MSRSDLLKVRNLSCDYSQRRVLDRVSFSLDEGEILAVVGPNGSGKSTLLKGLSGVLEDPVTGKVYIGEDDFLSLSAREQASKIGYLGSEVRVDFPLIVSEFVALGGYCLGGAREQSVRDALERTRTSSFRDRLVHTLSSGEMQLVAMARLLVQGARVLVLDESFSRMDIDHLQRMGELIRDLASKGYSILLVSHDVNFASLWSDRAILLKEGRVISDGKIREVFNRKNFLDLYPDAQLQFEERSESDSVLVSFGRRPN